MVLEMWGVVSLWAGVVAEVSISSFSMLGKLNPCLVSSFRPSPIRSFGVISVVWRLDHRTGTTCKQQEYWTGSWSLFYANSAVVQIDFTSASSSFQS